MSLNVTWSAGFAHRAFLAANVTQDMSDEEIHDWVRKAMELHIPPPPSWQVRIVPDTPAPDQSLS
jgi:hypothetical protein